CLPHQIFAGGYDFAVDVWAVGVTTFILMTGALPYEGEAAICTPSVPTIPDLQLPYHCSKLGADFVLQTLKKDISERPLAREAARHPWLTTKQPSDAPMEDSPQEEATSSFGRLLNCVFSALGGLMVLACSALGNCMDAMCDQNEVEAAAARWSSKASTSGSLVAVADKEILEKHTTDLTKQISVNLLEHQVSLRQ
ncbi:IPL1, partial [Symbiodinium pilosum]